MTEDRGQTTDDRGQMTEDQFRIADCARPPRLSEQARDGGQGLRI
jgi:hypothetical protein